MSLAVVFFSVFVGVEIVSLISDPSPYCLNCLRGKHGKHHGHTRR